MSQKIRIKLKSYDHNLVDKSAEKIVRTVKTTGAIVSGPIPLPTHKRIFTVNRSTFVNKKSREQFELSSYKTVTILNYAPLSSPGTFDVFNHMDLEYRWVSRFICQSKEDSMETMKYRHREWNQEIKDFWVHAREAFLHERFDNEINEGALMNREDVTECMKELSTDDVSYGNYTMTMLIFDEDEQHCEEKANMISQAINSSGFSSYVETINSMEAWWGSIPVPQPDS